MGHCPNCHLTARILISSVPSVLHPIYPSQLIHTVYRLELTAAYFPALTDIGFNQVFKYPILFAATILIAVIPHVTHYGFNSLVYATSTALMSGNNHHILRHNQRFNYPTCTDAFTEFLVLLPCHVIKEILILWVRY